MSNDSEAVADLADQIIAICFADAEEAERHIGRTVTDGATRAAAANLALVAILRASGRAIYEGRQGGERKPGVRDVATAHVAALQATLAEAVLQFMPKDDRASLVAAFARGTLTAAAAMNIIFEGETVQ